MATLRELFDQDELELILEAVDHRVRYYENRIPQQRINASTGNVKAQNTLDSYRQKQKALERILSAISEEALY